MKKMITIKMFIIALLWFSCLPINAQIKRNFWGLELGSSSKSEVSNFLKRNNLEIEQNSAGNDAFFVNDELELGGYMWSPTFGFFQNTLYTIQLMIYHQTLTNNGTFLDNSETTKSGFYDLKKKLRVQYPNEENIVDPQSPPNSFVLRDERTVIILELDEDNNLYLSYIDRRLKKLELSGSGL